MKPALTARRSRLHPRDPDSAHIRPYTLHWLPNRAESPESPLPQQTQGTPKADN